MTALTDQELIARGTARAGSQAKLATAIGYSTRVLSSANTGRGAPLSDEARARITRYVRTGKPVAVPGARALGRKPARLPAMGFLTLGFTDEEWEEITAAAKDTTLKQWFGESVLDYLANCRTMPPPEPVPDGAVKRRLRLDKDVIRKLTDRTVNVEARPCYVRMAALDHLKRRTRRRRGRSVCAEAQA